MQPTHYQPQESKALLSHPFGAWLLLFPGFVAALAKGTTIACERRFVLHSGRSASSAGRMAARARRRPAGVVSFPIKGLQQRPGGYAARPKAASLLAPGFVAPLAKDGRPLPAW